jgi:hypothetical protein
MSQKSQGINCGDDSKRYVTITCDENKLVIIWLNKSKRNHLLDYYMQVY